MNLSSFDTITSEALYVLSSEVSDVDDTLKVQQKIIVLFKINTSMHFEVHSYNAFLITTHLPAGLVQGMFSKTVTHKQFWSQKRL